MFGPLPVCCERAADDEEVVLPPRSAAGRSLHALTGEVLRSLRHAFDSLRGLRAHPEAAPAAAGAMSQEVEGLPEMVRAVGKCGLSKAGEVVGAEAGPGIARVPPAPALQRQRLSGDVT